MKARRLLAVKQLTYVCRACDLYQPEVVRCNNEEGEGSENDVGGMIFLQCTSCYLAALLTGHSVTCAKPVCWRLYASGELM